MQKIKTTVSLLIAVFLLVISVPSASISAAELRYGKTVISQMSNKEALTYLYNSLVDTCKKDTPQEIEINTAKYKISSAELISLYHIFLADYPEYFWLDGSCKYANDIHSNVCLLIPSYSVEGTSLKKANDLFQNKVNQLTAGLDGKNDYEKSLILHDRLAENTTYQSTENDQNAYGALVEGVAVCAGYSKAYQHLLHKVGIPAWCVMGTSLNPANNHLEAHEWNLVLLDDKWYYTDVTWDDQEEFLFYAYLNITSKQMDENHTITEFREYLPTATATENNYFYKNSLVFDTLDSDRLSKLLKDNDYDIKIYVDEKIISAFKNNLYRNFDIIMRKSGMKPGYTYSYSVVSVGGEIDISVNLIEPNHQHNLSLVAAKSATCTAKGNVAYYTCSCGKWFEDSAAATEITDKQSVSTPAIPHVYSHWSYDNINHWKDCSKCGAEMANSMDHHTDNDSNSKCDSCGYNLPKNQIAASPTPTNPVQNNTVSNSSQVNSTESTQESSSSPEETASKEETVLEPEDTPVAEAIPKKKLPIIPIAIGGASATVIAAGVGIFFILKH